MRSSTGVLTSCCTNTPAAISGWLILHLAGHLLGSSGTFRPNHFCTCRARLWLLRFNMARPKSMPDFTSLLDASYSPLAGISEKERPRKKPSISLAAGLIMASETQSPKSLPHTPQQSNGTDREGWNEGLFYAYAQKVYTPVAQPSQLPPSIFPSTYR